MHLKKIGGGIRPVDVVVRHKDDGHIDPIAIKEPRAYAAQPYSSARLTWGIPHCSRVHGLTQT
jgi:hypothetical protein